jgi:hypothetical protein
MKTTNRTTKRFPDGLKMILYIAAVAVLGFVSCAVKAGDPVNDSANANSLEAIFKTQVESEIRLENWMLNFNDENLAEVEDDKVVIEDWMLDPASFTIPEYLIVEKDAEPVLEYWMLNPGSFVVERLLIATNDH